MSTRVLLTRLLLALGLAFLAGGLLLGLLPRTASGVHCGSAFRSTNRDAMSADFGTTLAGSTVPYDPTNTYVDRCDTARSATRIPAIMLLLVGGALAVAGLIVLAPHNQATRTSGPG